MTEQEELCFEVLKSEVLSLRLQLETEKARVKKAEQELERKHRALAYYASGKFKEGSEALMKGKKK